jgi:capsular polysaccharide biosynthesis protein
VSEADAPTLPPEIDVRTLGQPMAIGPALNRWQGFVQTAPTAASATPGPIRLISAGESEAWFAHVHGQTGDVPALGAMLLDDVTLSGAGLMFRGDGMLVEASEPYLVARSLAAAEGLPPERLIRRERQVRLLDPAILAVGPGHAMWGHWLLDILPRIEIARRALGEAEFARCVIPLPDDVADWAPTLLAVVFGMKPERAMRYKLRDESVLCRRAALATYAHRDYFFHPFFAEFYRDLAARAPVQGGLPRRILVSRRRFVAANPQAAHRLAQEAAFEAAAAARGFVAVSPETMDISSQIALFTQAEAVLGVCGSGLHNTVFSPPGAVVGQIGMPNARQSRIAAACGHRLACLVPDDPNGAGDMSIDAAGIDALLDAMATPSAGW